MAFKAFLRQAIANFAAANSSPAPPLISSHTRPNKGKGNPNNKDKKSNKALIATPHIVPTPVLNRRKTHEVALPKTPPTNNNTWGTVARNSHKKASVVVGEKTHAFPLTKAAQRQSSMDKIATSGSDKRLFVRLL
ncbi:hypothetical protein EV44_g3812 [Erysiphe necator]|uniref:Uncharacterized protein n=1 Tax=Uncinula necator TaxID=52586 RepID=A0A0B1P4E3_UNCNE|nr:hypothetical protein EV44_g3812 [Erysiphe necator]